MIVVASHRQTLPTSLVARMFLPPLSQLARLSRRIHSYSVVTFLLRQMDILLKLCVISELKFDAQITFELSA
jgi:hypothetical protein